MNSMKNRSHEDPIAISQYCFDEKDKAMRVVMVGSGIGEQPHWQKVQSGQIAPEQSQLIVKETEIKVVEVPVIVKEIEFRDVEVVKYITEYKTIEIPVVVTEIKFVEVPVIVPSERIEVLKEVPVYVTQTVTEYKDLPKWLVACLVLQATCTLIFSILKFFK